MGYLPIPGGVELNITYTGSDADSALRGIIDGLKGTRDQVSAQIS